ncbi:MAG: DUF4351 domain-containing protein [Anaerolineae bacterium]|nr:DUF4351 domain-containing protein [Anaerolineae bacterium]
MNSTENSEYDSPWKEILVRFFPEFIAFFFPAIFADIEWSKGHEFLDQELQQVVREATVSGKRVDKLVRVWRKNGIETWVLIHIEIQGQKDGEFTLRMYVYNYRIFDRYQRPVASLAILTDEYANWRPDHYESEIWGSKSRLDFPVVKLLDYRQNWDELANNPNPFAIVVMAHLQTQETRRKPEERQNRKFTLTKMLYDRGYSEKQIWELFRFIDWLMILPPGLKEAFAHDIARLEEEKRMQYVTTIERDAIERGLTKGLQQGQEQALQRSIMRILFRRFGTVPTEISDHLEKVSLETLEQLLDVALEVMSVKEFSDELAHHDLTTPNS